MMKTRYIHIFSSVICALLLVACEKQTASAPAAKEASIANDGVVSKDISALVVIKAAEPEDEHQEHGDEEKSEHRELGVHVHGAASMSLVLENSLLNITMTIPAMDAVGFEHPAVSADEQAILQKALTHLQNPDALFLLSKNADCHLLNGTVETALLNKEAKPGAHADVDIRYQWQCKKPEDLKQVSVQLFTHFSHLQKIQTSWISSTKQSAVELTKENAVLVIE
jgi:hypothetical protein